MINKIVLKNYKNIKDTEFEINENINLIIKPNGFGKTNFLESIYYSVFRKSFRPMNSYKEILGPFEEFTRVTFENNSNELELIINNTKSLSKQLKINGKRPTLRKSLDTFPTLLFAPHSVDLVNGEPSVRRNDLDSFLSLKYQNYLAANYNYSKVLKNKNALLKAIRENKSSKSELTFWNEKLAEHAGIIFKIRHEFFNKIAETLHEYSENTYHDLKNLEVKYVPNLESDVDQFENHLLEKYTQNINKEIIVGKTLYGIHKDDYEFLYDQGKATGLNLRYSGSRGQQRIGSLLFKLVQLKNLETKYNESTLILLDDIMSELDANHRGKIAEILLNIDEQIILTSADENEIPKELLKVGNKLEW